MTSPSWIRKALFGCLLSLSVAPLARAQEQQSGPVPAPMASELEIDQKPRVNGNGNGSREEQVSIETMRNVFDKLGCRLYGNGFKFQENLGYCHKFDAFAYGFITKDFSKDELRFEGQRIATTDTAEPVVPLLFYYRKDVTNDVGGLGTSLGATLNWTAGKITDYGPMITYVSVQTTIRGGLGSSRYSLLDDRSAFYDEGSIKVYPGLLRQVWVRVGGLQVGIQPSKFNFFRSGYSALPGYASFDETAAVSYVWKLDKDTTLSVAAEDGERRNREEGLLAKYDSKISPDYVALVRKRWRNTLMHASAAVHPIRDEITGKKTNGFAASVGGEVAFRSPSWFSDERKNTVDRFMGGVAVAEGAIGYLGIPNMAIDYIAQPDGSIDKSQGVSLILSYERNWRQDLKSPVTLSLFKARMASSGVVYTAFDSFSELGFDIDVKGLMLQIGLQKVVSSNFVVGAEASHTWSSAKGSWTYDGLTASGSKESISFQQFTIYGAYRF
jgi:hypothetical protein